MGCGKSTAGAALAARLGVDFIDLDQALEAASGRTIEAWFETQGEREFRAAERAELAAVLDRFHARGAGGVIALGGGAFADPATQGLLAGRTRTVWLDVPLSAIRTRIVADGGRPLYQDPTSVARLFTARLAAYERADVRIKGDDAPERVVERILAALAAPPGLQAGRD